MRMPCLLVVLLWTGAVTPAAPAAAQRLDLIMPGTSLRVVGHYSSVRGTFESFSGDTLHVQLGLGGASVGIPLASITALRTVERRSSAGGALVGAKWGALVGAALMALDCWSDLDECRDYWEMPPDTNDDRAITTAAISGAVGVAAIGAIIGAVWPGSREIAVPLPRATTLRPTPNGGLALKIGF
jgi:hypothetical protein